jgi:hypothetical protein
MKKAHLFALLSLFTFSVCASFGPWPHPYFKEGGLLSCSEERACLAPGFDDIEALKSDWIVHEAIRLERINRLETLARASAEKILEIGQLELQENENSVFGQVYMDYGSRLLTNISEKEIESMRLWVSQSSPMFLKIRELEAKLTEWQNQIDAQEDPELRQGLILFRNEKYKEWLETSDFKDILTKMDELQKQAFPKKDDDDNDEGRTVDGLMNLSFDIATYLDFDNCPLKVEKKIGSVLGKVQFSQTHRKARELDPVKDQDYIRFILVGKDFGKPLKVLCDKGGVLARVKASYKNHLLKIKYKTKNGRDGVTEYRLPSKSEILSEFK